MVEPLCNCMSRTHRGARKQQNRTNKRLSEPFFLPSCLTAVFVEDISVGVDRERAKWKNEGRGREHIEEK